MSKHGNAVNMQSVAALADERKEKRIREMVYVGNMRARGAMRKAVSRIDERPEPKSTVANILRNTSHPFRESFEWMARLIDAGLSHYDARVFAAEAFVGFVDGVFADRLDPLPDLAARSMREDAEADAAIVKTLSAPCPAHTEYALDEAREAEVAKGLLVKRLAQEASQRHLSISR